MYIDGFANFFCWFLSENIFSPCLKEIYIEKKKLWQKHFLAISKKKKKKKKKKKINQNLTN